MMLISSVLITPDSAILQHSNSTAAHHSIRITALDSIAQRKRKHKNSTAQHWTALDSTAQHSTGQQSTGQQSTAQHSTGQHWTALDSTAQHRTAQHSTAQHSTAQHSTAQSARTKPQSKCVPISVRQRKQADRVGESQHAVELLFTQHAR